MLQNKILAIKISPSFLIGEKLEISSRDLKPKKTPPKKSEDCDTRFYEYVAEDNTDIKLLEDYLEDNFCEDLISNSMFTLENLNQGINLEDITVTKIGNVLKGTKFLIYSKDNKIKSKEKVINKSGRHKAEKYIVKDLTICYLEKEDSNIFKSSNIDLYRTARLTQKQNKDGYLEISK